MEYVAFSLEMLRLYETCCILTGDDTINMRFDESETNMKSRSHWRYKRHEMSSIHILTGEKVIQVKQSNAEKIEM